jgi:hypothetical protein
MRGVIKQSLQPGFLPENQAPGFAPAVEFAITSDSIKMNGVFHSPAFVVVDCVTGLVSPLVNAELFVCRRTQTFQA